MRSRNIFPIAPRQYYHLPTFTGLASMCREIGQEAFCFFFTQGSLESSCDFECTAVFTDYIVGLTECTLASQPHNNGHFVFSSAM